MFCSHCGKPIESSSRFCTACGATVNSAPFTANAYQPTPRLTRPRNPRMIAGVCSGFALHYGWDLNLVRVITALFIILTGVGALAYIAAWVIIPEAPYALPIKST
ncbi:MAG TPA: PspC domain-containing protein [Edaphobacter sp.]|uniref:PspC domain-containing protein n=1 Tax=Edaphobacter sp. TaxID=1934404 RepID=UPI002C510EEE|nr:PspC domain-containing protein [Edaphobacter sp.]HUZ96312.1 PspC domain-containing protein [Edaphobacter sp.]